MGRPVATSARRLLCDRARPTQKGSPLMQKRISLVLATVTAALLAAACGGQTVGGGESNTPTTSPTPPSGSGTLDVTYSFSGTEYPNSVELMLIDGGAAGQSCTTLP